MDLATKTLLVLVSFLMIGLEIWFARQGFLVPFLAWIAALVPALVAFGGAKIKFQKFDPVTNPMSEHKNQFKVFAEIKTAKIAEGVMREKVTPLLKADTGIDQGLQFYAHLAYGFGPPGMLLGAPAGAKLAGFFLALKKRNEAKGTIYESHFNWIVHTYCLMVVGLVATIVMIGFISPISDKIRFYAMAHMYPAIIAQNMGMIPVLAVVTGFTLIGVWVFFRLNKGYRLLMENRPIPE